MKRFLTFTLCALLALSYSPTLAQADDLYSTHDLTVADRAEATPIVLSGESVEITEGGTYVLSGEISNGSIRVSLAEEDRVWLLLDGVTVHSASGAALYTENCKKVVITLAEGTVNTFTQAAEGDENATIYSRDDLTVNGTGALVVESATADAINVRDSLRIVSGNLTINAGDDGLVGKDEVTIGGADTLTVPTLQITAGGDGIKSTNDEDSTRGYVLLAGGVISVSAQKKGIEGITSVSMSDGELTVASVDDAIHASDVVVTGGTLSLSSDDDGIHADNALTISGGVIDIPRSYEGLEATNITITGGDITVVAEDDGINGAGGDSAQSDQSGWYGPGRGGGRDMFSSSTGELTITGGNIYVSAVGDGVDVNGSCTMTGGVLIVRGPTNSGNGALDYDSGFTITGGTLVAVGASGMAQGVTAPSIPGVMADLRGASGALRVLDASGNEILTAALTGSYESIILYSDAFTENAVYTLQTDSATQSITVTTSASNGGGWGNWGGGGWGGDGGWGNWGGGGGRR